MRKIRFYRLFFILIVAVIFVAAFLVILFQQGQVDAPPQQQSLPSSPQPIPSSRQQELGLELPQLPLTPQTMTNEQKEAAIETAAQDAYTSALATGQSEERARQAGDQIRHQARRAFYPSQP